MKQDMLNGNRLNERVLDNPRLEMKQNRVALMHEYYWLRFLNRHAAGDSFPDRQV